MPSTYFQKSELSPNSENIDLNVEESPAPTSEETLSHSQNTKKQTGEDPRLQAALVMESASKKKDRDCSRVFGEYVTTSKRRAWHICNVLFKLTWENMVVHHCDDYHFKCDPFSNHCNNRQHLLQQLC